ncbi:MAG: hypothetical protein ACLQAT_18275 [Candidatus Binataceae bacterium]
MLPKEKRRVKWSIAVGAVVAGLIAGYYRLQAFEANQRLHILVADCEKIVKPTSIGPNASEGLTDEELRDEGYDLSKAKPPPTPIENPLKLTPVENSNHFFPGVKSIVEKPPLPDGYVVQSCDPKNLVGYEKLPLFQATLLTTAEEADNGGRSSALIAFLIFCLPLAWYLLLDRIRELSAAIAGRDRSP